SERIRREVDRQVDRQVAGLFLLPPMDSAPSEAAQGTDALPATDEALSPQRVPAGHPLGGVEGAGGAGNYETNSRHPVTPSPCHPVTPSKRIWGEMKEEGHPSFREV